jgi:thiol reductant ABC exporter CydC subunit
MKGRDRSVGDGRAWESPPLHQSGQHALWHLLKLAAPFARQMALAALLGFAAIGASIGLMSTSGYLIARAALRPSIADLQLAIVGVRFFGIARGVFRYLERCVSHDAAFHLLSRLRVWFYRALEPLAPARLLQYRSGDLLPRLVADIETLENLYLRGIAPPVVAVLVALLAAGLLGSFDPRLAAVLGVFLLVAGLGLPLLTRHLGRQAGRQVVAIRAELNCALVDGIQGLAALLAFGGEGRQLDTIRQLGRSLARRQGRVARIGGLQAALVGLLMNLAVLAVLAVAIPLVSSGQLDGVYLALLALATISCFEAVLPLPQALQYLEHNEEAARRLFDIVAAEPTVVDPPSVLPVPGVYALRVENLRFSYEPGAPPALDGVSFELPPGNRVAIVGPSGAGKSTLVHLLLRFWDYDNGRILLAGRELKLYGQDDLRRSVAVVSQHTHLFNATVRENLLLGRPEASDQEIIQAAREAQIHEFIQSLPQGYDTRIGEQGVRLSGGQRQRLAIARAALKQAPMLILDEPTADLDALTESEVLVALRALMAGRTSLIITHRLVGLEDAATILVLREGRIVEQGRHAELLHMEGHYRRMWDLQNQLVVGA